MYVQIALKSLHICPNHVCNIKFFEYVSSVWLSCGYLTKEIINAVGMPTVLGRSKCFWDRSMQLLEQTEKEIFEFMNCRI